jgi:putative phosphoesterase
MKIGVISDTHGFLDPRVLQLFKGVDHILHAGDIGYPSIILELEHIAPVTAVLGNTDYGLDFKETEWVTLGDKKFMVHHIVPPFTPDTNLQSKLTRTETNVLVFGHTHKRFAQSFGDVLLFNPGYSGTPRMGVKRSVGMIEISGETFEQHFIEL